MAKDQILLQLDRRRRAPLGKLAGDNTLFLATVEDDGVITLTPAKVVPINAFLQHPKVREALRRAQEDPGSLVRTGRPVRKED